MKKDIHPKYYEAAVKCACGNTFTVGSTLETISVEICSRCHPFYTGKQKLVDTARRVEKFQAKQAKAQVLSEKHTQRKKSKIKTVTPKTSDKKASQNQKTEKSTPEGNRTPSPKAESTASKA